MGSEGCVGEFSLSELVDLPINGIRQMNKGCGSYNGQSDLDTYHALRIGGFSFPNNNEFAWGGLGEECNESNMRPLCNYPEGQVDSITRGFRGTVKRTAYASDPTQCCFAQEAIVGNNTCDPKYLNNYSTAECDDLMLTQCQKILFTSEESQNNQAEICKNWISTATLSGRDVANGYMEGICALGENSKSEVCQAWCAATKKVPQFNTACTFTPQPTPPLTPLTPLTPATPPTPAQELIGYLILFASSSSSVLILLVILIIFFYVFYRSKHSD